MAGGGRVRSGLLYRGANGYHCLDPGLPWRWLGHGHSGCNRSDLWLYPDRGLHHGRYRLDLRAWLQLLK